MRTPQRLNQCSSHFIEVGFFDEHQQFAMYRMLSRILNNVEIDDKSIIKMDAPGGFGKTHMLRELCRLLEMAGVRSKVATFTGRAASQVMKDGLTTVSTLHSLLLEAVLDDEGNLLFFKDKLEGDVAETIGEVLFCDEASMVPREMFTKIRTICDKYNIRLVLIGDKKQLPSIEPKGESFDLLRRTDIEFESLDLVTNYRQKEGSAIADLCMHLRETNSIPRKKAHDLRMLVKSKVTRLDFHQDNKFDAIICGTHAMRRRMNALVRRARGFHDEVPMVGETVICKRNDIVSSVRINNGELFEVKAVFPSAVGCHNLLLAGLDSDRTVRVNVPDVSWEGDSSFGRKLSGQHVQQFEFGYAITCHSAQGSQFDNLLYIDEDVSYFLDQSRFRYTAVSRARKFLTVAI